MSDDLSPDMRGVIAEVLVWTRLMVVEEELRDVRADLSEAIRLLKEPNVGSKLWNARLAALLEKHKG